MTSDDLTPQQIAVLKEQVGQRLRWLAKLCDRMKQQRWPHDDPLKMKAEAAREAVSRFYVDLYDRGMGKGNTSPFGKSPPH